MLFIFGKTALGASNAIKLFITFTSLKSLFFFYECIQVLNDLHWAKLYVVTSLKYSSETCKQLFFITLVAYSHAS